VDQSLGYDEAVREAALWVRKAEDGGMLVLLGTGSASACVTGSAPHGGTGGAPGREDLGLLRPDAVVDLTECSVRTCVAQLSASLASTRGATRMTHLVDALRDRDGGDITVVLDHLHAARDPRGVAWTVARRLAAEPGVRVVVGTRAPAADEEPLPALGPCEVLRVTEPARELADGALASERSVRVMHALGYVLGDGIGAASTVWPELVGSVSQGPLLTGEDIARVLADCGACTVTDPASGRVRIAPEWRQAVELLSPPGAPGSRAEGHRRVAEMLHAHGTQRGWQAVDPYVRHSLPAHAALGGALDALLADEAALDQVDQTVLAMEVADHYRGRAARPANATAIAAAHDLLAAAPSSARRRVRALGLAMAGVPVPRTQDALWWPRWADHRITGSPVELKGHDGDVTALTTLHLADGRALLASGDEQGRVRLWDPLTTEQAGAPLYVSKAEVTSLTGLTDQQGRTVLAVGDESGAVSLWDPLAGRRTVPLVPEANGAGKGVALAAVPTPEGGTALAVGSDRVRLLDPFRGELLGATFEGTDHLVQQLTLVPGEDGALLLAGACYAHGTCVWDLATGRLLPGPTTTGTVWGSVCAPTRSDGRTVLATGGGADGRVLFWDPLTGEELGGSVYGHDGALSKQTGTVSAVTVLERADGTHLVATASIDDDTIRLWDPLTGAPAGGVVLQDATGLIRNTATAVRLPAERTLLAVATGRTVWLWDPFLHAGREVGATRPVRELVPARTSDGDPVLGVADTRAVWTYRAGSGSVAVRRFLPDTVNDLHYLVPLSDGRLLVAGHRRSAAQLWDPHTGERVGPDLGPAVLVRPVPLSDGTTRVATAVTYINPSADRTPEVRLWDPLTGEEPTVVSWKGGRIRFSRAVPMPGGGVWLACRTDDRSVRFFDAAGGAEVGRPLTDVARVREAWILSPLTLPNGSTVLLTGSDEGLVTLWDPVTGTEAGPPLRGHQGGVPASAALPGGRGHAWCATGGADGTVRLWRVKQDGEQPSGLRGECVGVATVGSVVRSLAALPDGGLAVGTSSGLLVLDVDTDRDPDPSWPGTCDAAGVDQVAAPGDAAEEPGTTASPAPVRGAWRRVWHTPTRAFICGTGLVTVGERDLIVSVTQSDEITFRDAGTGQSLPDAAIRSPGKVTALTAAVAQGRPLVAGFVEMPDPQDDCESCDGPRDDNACTTCAATRAIRIWDAATGERVGDPLTGGGDFSRHRLIVGELHTADSVDGPVVAVMPCHEIANGPGMLWHVATGRFLGEFLVDSLGEDSMTALSVVDTSAQTLLTGVFTDYDEDDDRRVVHVWDTRTGDVFGQPWGYDCSDGNELFATTMLDGHPVAVVPDGDRIRLWRLADRKPMGSLTGNDVGPAGLLVFGTSTTAPIMAAGHQEACTIWDLTTRRRVTTIDGLGDLKPTLFTPEGLLVLTGPEGMTAIDIEGVTARPHASGQVSEVDSP
jgi:WD40 repeat protein